MSEPTKYVVPTDMLTGEWPGMRVYGDTTRVVTLADALTWKDAECATAVAEEYSRWRKSAEDVLATLDSLEAEYQRGRADERAAICALVTAMRPLTQNDSATVYSAVAVDDVLAAIEGRVVNDAPATAPPGCAHCGHSRSRHYLKGDRCANASCGCIYPSHAAAVDGASGPRDEQATVQDSVIQTVPTMFAIDMKGLHGPTVDADWSNTVKPHDDPTCYCGRCEAALAEPHPRVAANRVATDSMLGTDFRPFPSDAPIDGEATP